MSGKIISLWGFKSGWGTSSMLSILAHHISNIYDGKILCANLNYNNNFLDKVFGIVSKKTIDELLILLKTNELDESLLKSYTVNIKGTNIDFLPGSNIKNCSFLDSYFNDEKILSNFIESLRSNYDLILFDLHSGSSNLVSKKILSISDIKVAVIKQDKHSMSKMYSIFKELNIKFDLGFINLFDTSLSFAKRDLDALKVWEKSFTLPYCSDFLEALNSSNIRSYYTKNTILNKNIGLISETLLDKCSLVTNKSNKKSIKSLFSNIVKK